MKTLTKRKPALNNAWLATCFVVASLSTGSPAFSQCNVLTVPNLINGCPGDIFPMNATLTGTNNLLGITWTPATGLSSTTVINPTLTVPGTSGWYHVTVQTAIPGSNLVTNGDFSAGNTGFSSAYTYVSGTTLLTEGKYAVTTNPQNNHPAAASFGDHTTGTGNMMAMNAASTPVTVWSKTVSVIAGTTYAFSAWFSNWSSTTLNLPLLQFRINGAPLGTGSFSIPSTQGLWSQYYATWTSPTTTTVTISIFDSQTAAFGNDFAIDDISFSQLCTLTDSVYVNATCPPPCNDIHLPDSINICKGDSTIIPATISGLDSVLSINWAPPIGLSSTTVLNPMLTASTSGWYNLTVQSLIPGNLVTNGDFSAGNIGFSSAYTFVSGTALLTEGSYAVNTNPQNNHPNAASFGDHTTGTGRMMAMNGASTPVNVWSQTISVTPGADYAFSAWFSNWSSITTALPTLQFRINGTPLGTGSFSIPGTQGLWSQYYATWHNVSSTSVTISIFDSQTAAQGNDFAIDDISFQRICTVKDSTYVNVKNCKHPCADSTSITYTSSTDAKGNCIITATANVSSVYNILGYRWSGAGTPVTHYNHTGSDSYTFVLPSGNSLSLSCLVYIVDTTLSDSTGPCCQVQLNQDISCHSGLGADQEQVTNKQQPDVLQQEYKLSPNPTSGVLHIIQAVPDEDLVQAEILDASGKVVFKKNMVFSAGSQTLNLQLTPGLYLLQLRDAKGKSYTLKLVMEQSK